MKTHAMIKFVVAFLSVAPMVALPETSEGASKSTSGETSRQHKRKPAVFEKDFKAWADKQDWFALGDTAEFGDLNREKYAEKGRTFGYSVEFVDSKGKKHVLGIGLAKEPELAEKRAMKKNMAEMWAKKNLAMHGKAISTDASGRQSRSFTGTINAALILSKTIVRPGSEEKWILCVCTKVRGRQPKGEPLKKDQ